jgi:hypothetical protein
MRQCKKCLGFYEESFFYDKKNRLGNVRKMYTCKTCYSLQVKAWRTSNKEAVYSINRRARYKSTYGVCGDSIPKLGYCPLCQREDVKLVVDHCHDSDRVRGLICYSCNTVLGTLENPIKLLRMQEYLSGTLVDPKLVKPELIE